jgi:hypothetical protein
MVEPEALRQAGLGHAFGPNGLIDGSLGFHRKYLLCIVDECCLVPAELWEAAEPLASNAAGVNGQFAVPAGGQLKVPTLR